VGQSPYPMTGNYGLMQARVSETETGERARGRGARTRTFVACVCVRARSSRTFTRSYNRSDSARRVFDVFSVTVKCPLCAYADMTGAYRVSGTVMDRLAALRNESIIERRDC